jgi:DNA-binding NtrC family response regulator
MEIARKINMGSKIKTRGRKFINKIIFPVVLFLNKPIYICKNAQQGLRALKEEHFDIVICDFRLPDMNGLDFFELVGNHSPHILKILISAYGDEKLSSELSRVGVHAFIPKPFSLKQLIHIMVHRVEINQKNQRICVQSDSLAG